MLAKSSIKTTDMALSALVAGVLLGVSSCLGQWLLGRKREIRKGPPKAADVSPEKLVRSETGGLVLVDHRYEKTSRCGACFLDSLSMRNPSRQPIFSVLRSDNT